MESRGPVRPVEAGAVCGLRGHDARTRCLRALGLRSDADRATPHTAELGAGNPRFLRRGFVLTLTAPVQVGRRPLPPQRRTAFWQGDPMFTSVGTAHR